jgi:hypothetical protein
MIDHEHVFSFTAPDGTTVPTNRCQVEGCGWFTAVSRPKRRRAPSRVASDGFESLQSLLRFS